MLNLSDDILQSGQLLHLLYSDSADQFSLAKCAVNARSNSFPDFIFGLCGAVKVWCKDEVSHITYFCTIFNLYYQVWLGNKIKIIPI